MFTKIIQGFSKYSHKSAIPNLLKNPKYTRRGYQTLKTEARIFKKPSISEDIPNSHLYYDYTKACEKFKANPPIKKYESTDLDFILNMLNNQEYIQKQDFRLFKAIKQLNLHHPEEVKKNWEIFDRAYKITLENVRTLDIYNFRSFTQISQQYYLEDKQVWEKLYKNSIQFFVGWEHEQTPLLSKVIEKTYQQSFLFCFNIIMRQVRKQNIDISKINLHFDYLMRNHLRFPRVHSQDVYNKWENIDDKNFLGNFLSHFTFCIQQRTDFYNDIDKEVKEKQVELFLHQGQKICLESFDQLNQSTKQNILKSITYSRYQYKPLFDKLK